MAHKTVPVTLAVDLAAGGTLVISYPAGTSRGDYLSGSRHALAAPSAMYQAPTNFTVAFGASTITLTWAGPTTLKAGTRCFVQLNQGTPPSFREDYDFADPKYPPRVAPLAIRQIALGSPAAASATGVLAATAAVAGVNMLAAPVTLATPRNITLTSSGNDSAATFTLTGVDVLGNAMVEVVTGGNAGAATGVKAFARLDSVVASAASAGTVSVGFGTALGLPVYLPSSAFVLKEIVDNAAAGTAGTFVAGLSPATKATGTNADVRGTYTPSSAPDGSKGYVLIVALGDPLAPGNPQFTG